MKRIKSILRLLLIICIVLSVYAIIIQILASVLLKYMDADYVRSIQIVTNLAIIISIIGVIYQFRQYNINAEQRRKHDFISLTAKYTEIQKLFLSHQDLSVLQDEILKRNIGNLDKGVNYEDMYGAASTKEISICSIMFQLMEDVYIVEELEVDEKREDLVGWNRLFRDWIFSNRVWAIWLKLSHHFGQGFNDYVKACRNELSNHAI
jgi:hypothetical protein